MTDPTSIMNIGDLAKPATALVEKIAEATGGWLKPFQIKRVARAEAAADEIRAAGQIKITELEQRALRRFVGEEGKKQENMESITGKTIPQLEANADPSQIDNDWMTNFFEKCRLISDEEIQNLWSRVLAGEANNPGKYSKRTVDFIGSLDRNDADLFMRLCGFACELLSDIVPLVYLDDEDVYGQQEISFNELIHLEQIGLISFPHSEGLSITGLNKKVPFYYHGKQMIIEFDNDAPENTLSVGKVMLSQIGEELAPICGSKPVPGFLEYLVGRWAEEGYILSSPYPQAKELAPTAS